MALVQVVDAVAAHLDTVVAPLGAGAGGAEPAEKSDLPVVVVSITDVTRRLEGLGKLPQASATGALRIETTIDLTNPVAVFPDETVLLLSPDRRTLHLPHGPNVRADGTPQVPYAAGDLSVSVDAAALTVTGADPAAGEVRPHPDVGELEFGEGLPATGTLDLGYFVGEWEVRTTRMQGRLTVEAFAETTTVVDDLTRAAESALDPPTGIAGIRSLAPVGWGPIRATTAVSGDARSRLLAYDFDYELVEPLVGSGGGLIVRVGVVSRQPTDSTFTGIEEFEVIQEGSHP